MRNILILLCIATNCGAQKSISDFLSVPFPTELKSSRDGKTIAWVFNNKGSRNIFVAKAPSFTAKQISNYTGDNGMEITNLEFTPSGNTLLFVRGNAANGRGETANPAQLQTSTEKMLYRVDVVAGNLKEINKGSNPAVSPDGKSVAFLLAGQVWIAALSDTAKPKKLFTARGSQSQIRWSPDGEKIAFVSDRGDHSFIGIYSFSKKWITYPDPSVDNEMQPVWSPDGKNLAYINVPTIHNLLSFTPVRASNPWSIRVLNLSTEIATQVWKASEGKGSALFDELPNGGELLWWTAGNRLIFPYEGDGWQHLYALNMLTKNLQSLTPGEGEIENVILSNDGQTIYCTTNIGDINRRHILKIDIEENTAKMLTSGDGIEWSPVITATSVALLHSSATMPAWPALYQDGKFKNMAEELYPANFPNELVHPQPVTIKAKDGIEFTADLFLPTSSKKEEKHPALIFFHGGSRRQMLLGFHYSQYYSNAYALNQYFASRGYIVLSVNYRSGIGYGMEFREALNYGAAGASEVADVLAAGNYLKNREDVDNKKIALWGGSYGGFLTAHGLAQASDLFACGVDIHGVYNWNDEIPTFAPWYDYAKFPQMAQKALQSSPIYFIEGWRSPVLLIHGDDDRNVPFSESVNIAEKLRQQGVHTEQLIFADEVHGFLLHRNWVKAYEATYNFVSRQMNVDKL